MYSQFMMHGQKNIKINIYVQFIWLWNLVSQTNRQRGIERFRQRGAEGNILIHEWQSNKNEDKIKCWQFIFVMIMVRLYVTPFTVTFLYITLICVLKIWCVEIITKNITISDAWVLEHFNNFVSVIIGITLVILLTCILSG